MNTAATEFPPGNSNATTSAVILGQQRIADVPTVGEMRKAEKPKRSTRKTREALKAEYERGVTDGMTRAKKLPSGVWLWLGIAAAAGVAIGGWLL
jgi:hypothetical protein